MPKLQSVMSLKSIPNTPVAKEKVVVAWSGGKDSALALQAVLQAGHYEVVALVTTVVEDRERIGMHDVPVKLMEAQAWSLGLPLRKVYVPYRPSNAVYEARMNEAWLEFKARGVTSIVFGDLFLEEIKQYRDRTLAPLGLKPIYPLWGRDTTQLARDFITAGFQAVLVCINPQVLDASFAGRLFDHALLAELPPKADPCGENGEFHTFVFNGPGFKYPVEFVKGEITSKDSFIFCSIEPAPSVLKQKVCPQCGVSFGCGPESGKAHCWCHELPHLLPMAPNNAGCFCPQCLEAALAKTVQDAHTQRS